MSGFWCRKRKEQMDESCDDCEDCPGISKWELETNGEQ
jgi:hypothetical protein